MSKSYPFLLLILQQWSFFFFTLNIIICDIVVFRPLRRRSEQSRAGVAKENNTKNRISWRSLEKRRRTKDPSKQQKQQSSKSLLMSPVSTTFQSPKIALFQRTQHGGFMRKWAPSSSCEQDQFGKGKSRLHLMGWVFEKEERMQDSVRWSFDVLLIDKWIDRECQIGFCPLQEKREREGE